MDTRKELLIDFALAYQLTPAQTTVLPALFDHAAEQTGMDTVRLLRQAVELDNVGEYMADCAKKVAADYAKGTAS